VFFLFEGGPVSDAADAPDDPLAATSNKQHTSTTSGSRAASRRGVHSCAQDAKVHCPWQAASMRRGTNLLAIAGLVAAVTVNRPGESGDFLV
jgi:hypothetical protein